MIGGEVKITLEFYGSGEPSLELTAETPAEKAILAFLAEGYSRRWKCSPAFSYRAGGVDQIRLEVEPVEAEASGQ
jgi:hypothetical protein